MAYKAPELELVGKTHNLILGNFKAPDVSLPDDAIEPIYLPGGSEEDW